MDQQLAGRVDKYFRALSEVSRPSKDEEAASDFMVAYAIRNDLTYLKDKMNNVIVKREARGNAVGKNLAPVILQAHLDMVCVPKDYDWKQGVKVKEEEVNGRKVLRGYDETSKRYTSLGADDGIGVATIMGILDKETTLSHPPIIAVFTTDEEAGMGGARGLTREDMQKVAGDLDLSTARMINIDEEEDGRFSVGCAGGVRANLVLPIQWKKNLQSLNIFKIAITDLTGGHSGVEIDKKRANAHRLMGRVLDYLQEKGLEFYVYNIFGGEFDNAIAKESFVEFGIAEEQEQLLQDSVQEMRDTFNREYNRTPKAEDKIEPKLTISCEALPNKNQARFFTNKMLNKIITIMMLIPNDVLAMDIEKPGLVETSSNLGVIRMEDDALWFTCATRSSVASRKRMVLNQMKRLMDSVGGVLIERSDYPGWEYRKESPLRELFLETYGELFHNPERDPEPVARPIHAGLECGYFAEKLGDIDMIACGPTIHDVHTINETLFLDTVPKTVELLAKVLEKLSEE